jgi:chromosome condensin MukBEF MukE localization factor
MIAGELSKVCPGDEALSPCTDESQNEFSRQGLIDALVNLDLEYERERAVLRRSSLGDMPKARLLTRLKDQYRIRRQPYMQQLAALSELA